MNSTGESSDRLWKFKVSEVDDWVRAGGADEEKHGDAIPASPRKK